jgi:hypothetical protein
LLPALCCFGGFLFSGAVRSVLRCIWARVHLQLGLTLRSTRTAAARQPVSWGVRRSSAWAVRRSDVLRCA